MSDRIEKARKTLDKAAKIASILFFIALAFAIWFSIRYAKSKTKEDFDKRQTYFNDIHENFNKEWAQNAYWDSLKKETSVYVNTESGSEIAIDIEKQRFNDQFNVKSNSHQRPDLYNVLKYSIAENFNDSIVRGNLFYLCMNPLVLHKASLAIIDNRGITHKSYFNNKSVITLKYDSYKDGEGQGDKVFPKDVMLLEQLPFSLRCMNLQEPLHFTLNVLEPQLSSGAGIFAVSTAEINTKVYEEETDVILAFGNNKYCSFRFERAYPNRLLNFNYFGKIYTLKK